MPSPHAKPLKLSAEERSTLTAWSSRGRAATVALRATIVLRCADGRTISQVAADLGVSRDTVSKWRGRFAAHRLEGLSDDPRPGRPREISVEQVEQVIMTTLSREPFDGERLWSTRSLAAATGMSQSAISRIWRAYDRQPHVIRTWALTSDLRLPDLVCDVAGLYLNPPHHVLALCAVQQPPAQDAAQPVPGPQRPPASPPRIAHDEVRWGTRGLLAALADPGGPAVGDRDDQASGQGCLRFLKVLDGVVPGALVPHLVCANDATYKVPEVKSWLLRHPRFQLHVTPTSSSWYSVVERWLAEFASRTLYHVTHRDLVDLELAIRDWVAMSAAERSPFFQARNADQILATVAVHQRWISGTPIATTATRTVGTASSGLRAADALLTRGGDGLLTHNGPVLFWKCGGNNDSEWQTAHQELHHGTPSR